MDKFGVFHANKTSTCMSLDPHLVDAVKPA